MTLRHVLDQELYWVKTANAEGMLNSFIIGALSAELFSFPSWKFWVFVVIWAILLVLAIVIDKRRAKNVNA